MSGSRSSSSPEKPIPSPCVRNCCLNDEDVCLGCGRTLEDIRNWTRFSPEERDLALARARARVRDFPQWTR